MSVPPPFYIPPQPGAEKCQFCFCQPCVTNEPDRQAWWGNPTPPAFRNSRLRKDAYQRFHANMSHHRVWILPEYILKEGASIRKSS